MGGCRWHQQGIASTRWEWKWRRRKRERKRIKKRMKNWEVGSHGSTRIKWPVGWSNMKKDSPLPLCVAPATKSLYSLRIVRSLFSLIFLMANHCLCLAPFSFYIITSSSSCFFSVLFACLIIVGKYYFLFTLGNKVVELELIICFNNFI